MVSEYSLRYLGAVEDVSLNTGQAIPGRSLEAQLVDKLEDAQLEGKLPYLAPEDYQTVYVIVSKHGIKVMDSKKKQVMQRHPLHVIAQAIQYSDGLGRFNLVLKTVQPGKKTFGCYVFQTSTEEQAIGVVKTLQQMYSQFTQR
ncbi:PREDICTED: integrin beta-1-binding protein 1-like [Priapulus caudatus]|uniref:Integrin beta-1-binding protein 1-like n=1 Tax=Priapulus caudatus TaxID=37621 RepID=A0ABM1EQU5_PRICU|nr:PREDICTED: integrin beta-1-binding protein 1-like [Priapulus caudatus]